MVNKLYTLITVLFFLTTHTTSWSMLTVHKSCAPKKLPSIFNHTFHQDQEMEKDLGKKLPPVLTHTFHQHQKMRKDLGSNDLSIPITDKAKFFMNSLGKQTLREMGQSFLDLPKKDKKKVERRLTNDQKLWLRIGMYEGLMHKGFDFFILSELCGNEKMADQCCKLPIGQVLCYYAAAKEKRKDYPISFDGCSYLNEQCYMALTKNQAHILATVIQSGFIHEAEIAEFMHALDNLQNIDPQVVGNQQSLTDLIRLYPSLKQRAQILCNVPFPIKLTPISTGITIVIGTLMREKTLHNTISDIFSIQYGCIPFLKLSLGCSAFYLCCNSFYYKDHLKNNVLPNQPTLTNVLRSS